MGAHSRARCRPPPTARSSAHQSACSSLAHHPHSPPPTAWAHHTPTRGGRQRLRCTPVVCWHGELHEQGCRAGGGRGRRASRGGKMRGHGVLKEVRQARRVEPSHSARAPWVHTASEMPATAHPHSPLPRGPCSIGTGASRCGLRCCRAGVGSRCLMISKEEGIPQLGEQQTRPKCNEGLTYHLP